VLFISGKFIKDPRVHLANERTLFSWLSTCVIIGLAALALLNVQVRIFFFFLLPR
jgi:uncharacterized membrane protein YidH (DUF202 family)